MRIHELNLIRYGKFTDRSLSLPHRDRDIHLIVGPNEAGKSTVRSAIGDWLFGFPARTPLDFLHPKTELRIGGVIEQVNAESKKREQLAFDRIKGNKNTLRTPDDNILADSVIKSWLGNLQVQAFNKMHGLEHKTLVDGGAGILSASDDIGRMLFQSASGIEYLGDALLKLQTEADALWAPRRASNRAYYQALDAYDGALAEFRKATLRTRDWRAKHDELTLTAAQLEQAKIRDIDLRQQISRLERMRRVRPILVMLDTARAQRAELLSAGEVPLLDADAADVFAHANQDMALANADVSRLQLAVTEIQDSLQKINVDKNLLSLGEDITELNERRLQFRAYPTDMVKRKEEIRLEWVRVQELASGLGWSAGSEEEVRKKIPAISLRKRLESLISNKSSLAVDLKNAEISISDRQEEIDQAEKGLLELAAGAVNPDLVLAVEQATMFGDHDNVMKELQDEIDELSQEIESAMTSLGIWRKPLEALRSMLVPETTHIQSLIDQYKTDAIEEKAIIDAIEDKAKEVSQLGLDLQQFVRNFQPVSRDQVLELRLARDDTWQEIKQDPKSLFDSAAKFEGQIIRADQLADARLDRAQEEADRQSKSDNLAHKQRELEELEQRLMTVKSRMAQRASQWSALITACGLPELPLEMVLPWLKLRENALELEAKHSSATRRFTAQQATATQLRECLWKLLGREEPVPDLSVCLRDARDLIRQADQAQGQRISLNTQIFDGKRSLERLQGALSTAQQAWKEWTESWANTLKKAGYSTDVLADQVEAELVVMQEVDRLLDRIRSVRSERIETMQADLDGLAATAANLSARVAQDLTNHSPNEIAQELARRLDLAQKANETTLDLLEHLERNQTELLDTRNRLQSINAKMAPLMAIAGIEDVSLLGKAIERSDQRRDIEGRIYSAEQDLTLAADGLTLDEIRAEGAGIGADELMAEIDRQTAVSQDVVNQIGSLSNVYGAQKIEFDALDGTDLAARAEAQRQEAIAAMTDSAEQYLRLQTAARLLKWSIEKFRETKQGPMLAKASAIFNVLTMNSFSRLLVDSEDDSPRLLGIRPNGQQVEVKGMSDGSRDQLYLALRLSALELQAEQGFNIPLIADDLFINFDDMRSAAGFRVLGELSRNMQVIYLTHHTHLVPLAKEVLGSDLNVIQL